MRTSVHTRWSPRRRHLAWVGVVAAAAAWPGAPSFLAAQAPGGGAPPDIARVKQEEAREKLAQLEESMDRLSRLLQQSEPQNAARLRVAFQAARERLVREGMDRIVQYLKERKLDRALAEQGQIKVNLDELLSILLEKEIDPRELLKHIRRVRDIVTGLDKVVADETREKMASDEADQAGASAEALAQDLAKLEDLIRREKEIEKDARDPARASKESLGAVAPRQEQVRADTAALRQGDEQRAAAKPAATEQGEPGQPAPGGEGAAPGGEAGKPGESPPGEQPPGEQPPGAEPGAGQPPPPGTEARAPGPRPPPPAQPEPVLERKSLERAEEAMKEARAALEQGDAPAAAKKATEAREALEASSLAAQEKLERLRGARNFKELKEGQDATRKDAQALASRMKESPPLVAPPEGGVPGKQAVESAAQDMQAASGELGQGQAGKAAQSQKQALDKLKEGRQEAEEALEELQRALRDRMLAYLREKFTKMLNDQRAVSRETRSLDLKLKALRAAASASSATVEVDRKDRQLAETLSKREGDISVLAEDVIDLLAEDGTTLIFPGVVQEIQADLGNLAGLLTRIETGDRTQHIQREVEMALEDILKALEQAQRSPPPPNPDQGRKSKSGAGPLLPLSSELKMVRALEARVHERTRAFDQKRQGAELSPEEKLQVHAIQKKQAEVEAMLRKLRQAVGESR